MNIQHNIDIQLLQYFTYLSRKIYILFENNSQQRYAHLPEKKKPREKESRHAALDRLWFYKARFPPTAQFVRMG